MNEQALTNAQEQFDTFRGYEKEDEHEIRLCIETTVMIQGSRRENRKGIEGFYEKALEIAGEHYHFYVFNNRGTVKKITPRAYKELPGWFSSEAEDDEPNYGIYFQGGDKPGDASAYVLRIGRLLGEPTFLRWQMPVDYLLEHGAEHWVELTCRMTDELRILAGWSGFGSSMSVNLYNTQFEDSPVAILARRYPAVDFDDIHAFSGWLEPDPMRWPEGYIKRINWLTFLDPEKIERLGGMAVLEAALTEGEAGEGIIIHPLKHGILIQAGSEPSLGDVNRPDDLQYYRRVGQVLKPLRIPEQWLFGYNGIGGKEYTKQWLAYFDE